MLNNLPLPQIKAAANIVTVISEYLLLKKSGNGLVGKCPFHQEKSGSFRVNPDTQRFRCFGCSAAGDVIQFVQDIENITMTEAARRLAERFGVRIEADTQVKPVVPQAQARRIRSHAEQTSMECDWWVRFATEHLRARHEAVAGLACMSDGEFGYERRARVWRRIMSRWDGLTAAERFALYKRRRPGIVRDYRDDVAWTELLVSELMEGRLKDIPGDDMFRYIGGTR